MTDDFNSLLEESQVAWRSQHLSSQEHGIQNGHSSAWILPEKDWKEGLWPGIRASLSDYLKEHPVQPHRGVHNLKSSWVLCANLYFPFREPIGRPLLAAFLRDRVSPHVREVVGVELEYAEPAPLDPQSLLGEPGTGKRGANQTSPDVAFIVTTEQGRGLILTENKLSEHHFYGCSGRKKGNSNPDAKRCLDWPALEADLPGRCWQLKWAASTRQNRRYWDHLQISERGRAMLKRCPAASDGYQLFRQQALAEAIASTGQYDLVVSSVAYDARNLALLHSLRSTGIDNFAKDWGSLFDGRAKFVTWTHQEWVSWVRTHDAGQDWQDWLTYIDNRYGYS